MKLGSGKNKYTVKFKYSKTGRITIKNVYADTLEQAKTLFDREYKDFEIEIINWRTSNE